MWEHGGYLESVWQDVLSILRCGHLQCHDIEITSEMWARAEVTGTISTNATGRVGSLHQHDQPSCPCWPSTGGSKPHVAARITLLSACRIHGYLEIGECVT